MHAVVRRGPLLLLGLMVMLLSPFDSGRAVTAEVSPLPDESNADELIGEPAPALTLPSLRTGRMPVELADYRGKIVYLDFWSSWCAPCRRAMPQLDALRQEFPREDFEVVGVNVDPLADDGRRFLDRHPVSYPIAADAGGRAAERFGVSVLPAMFLIDRRGVIRAAAVGEVSKARTDLRAAVARLIEDGEVQ